MNLTVKRTAWTTELLMEMCLCRKILFAHLTSCLMVSFHKHAPFLINIYYSDMALSFKETTQNMVCLQSLFLVLSHNFLSIVGRIRSCLSFIICIIDPTMHRNHSFERCRGVLNNYLKISDAENSILLKSSY
jgi:hypothetical protein